MVEMKMINPQRHKEGKIWKSRQCETYNKKKKKKKKKKNKMEKSSDGDSSSNNGRRSLVFKEIRKYQRSTNLLIPKICFQRFVKNIFKELHQENSSNNNNDTMYKITPEALGALQEASEHYICELMLDANLLRRHAKRKTLKPNDLQLVRYIRKED